MANTAAYPLEMRPAGASSVHKRIVEALLDAIDVRYGDGIVKVDSYDPDKITDGRGVITAEVTKIEQCNPGLPDYFVSVSVLGLSFASEDPDKELIRALFDDAMAALRRLDNETARRNFDLHLPEGARLVGALPVTNAAIREGEDRHMFTIDRQLVFTDLVFDQAL